jgi:hypothetical protein
MKKRHQNIYSKDSQLSTPYPATRSEYEYDYKKIKVKDAGAITDKKKCRN